MNCLLVVLARATRHWLWLLNWCVRCNKSIVIRKWAINSTLRVRHDTDQTSRSPTRILWQHEYLSSSENPPIPCFYFQKSSHKHWRVHKKTKSLKSHKVSRDYKRTLTEFLSNLLQAPNCTKEFFITPKNHKQYKESFRVSKGKPFLWLW